MALKASSRLNLVASLVASLVESFVASFVASLVETTTKEPIDKARDKEKAPCPLVSNFLHTFYTPTQISCVLLIVI